MTKTKELRLVLANLHQRLYAQEDEGKKLVATVEDMWMGIGLDFETVINTPAFKEIQMHQLQSGSEQTLKKLMAKNPTWISPASMTKMSRCEKLMPQRRWLVRRQGSRRSVTTSKGWRVTPSRSQVVRLNEGVNREIEMFSKVKGGQPVNL